MAYADCGTYGALDAVCSELGLRRLPGLHCYDLFAGESRLAAFLDEQPGTYLLTDFLVRSFDRTVVRELGLDRHPELRDDYFRHYTRVVWLAQEPDETLRAPRRGGGPQDRAAAHRRRDRRRPAGRGPRGAAPSDVDACTVWPSRTDRRSRLSRTIDGSRVRPWR